MSNHATRFDVSLAIGAVVLGGANIALFVATGLDWLVIALGVVGVTMLVAVTVRFYGRYSAGAGLVLFATGWVILMLLGSVLFALWGGPDGTSGTPPSEPLLGWFAFLTGPVTSVPLILCGLGLLVNLSVPRARAGAYGKAPAAY